jgi:hypothetical protein
LSENDISALSIGEFLEIIKKRSPIQLSIGARITAAVISGIITAIVFFVVQGVSDYNGASLDRDIQARITRQMAPIQGQITKLREDLAKNAQDLALLDRIQPNAPKSLNGFRDLNEKQFAAFLPSLHALTRQPLSVVPANEWALRAIAQKLSNTDFNSTDYWPTVLQFISFWSNKSAAKVPARGQPDVIFDKSMSDPTFHKPVDHKIIALDGADISAIVFRGCRIIITGKTMRVRDVSFIDCVFDLPVNAPPTSFMKEIARALLASNGTAITSS